MSSGWTIRTGRLTMTPVGWPDLADLQAIKADPRVFGVMLGGVRSPIETALDLAEDAALWPAKGYGLWAVRETLSGAFMGLAGLADRTDGRGTGLRFAVWPEAQGRGLAREAAAAALRFGHDEAHLKLVVGVARESNFASRTVLGSIGMTERGSFERDGYVMLVFESRRPFTAR